MGVVSSAGRHPAKQIIRDSKRMEKELVGKLSKTADNWPDLFAHLGRIVQEKGNKLSPIGLANEIDQTMAAFEQAITLGEYQHGQFWGKRYGKRSTYREGLVISHGHPLVEEDGISLWNVMLKSGRTGTNFYSTARSNLSEHALGRWIERSGLPTEGAIGRALMDAAILLHHIDWVGSRDSHNEFSLPVDDIVLSGLVRGVIGMGIKVPSYLFDIRTALTHEQLSHEQKLQLAEVRKVLAKRTLVPLMQIIDTRRAGPIKGCAIPPSRRQDWITYDGRRS